MPDLSDNGFYLILGLVAFWGPILLYLFALARRDALLRAEEQLQEELAER